MADIEYDTTGPQPHRCNARIEDLIQVGVQDRTFSTDSTQRDASSDKMEPGYTVTYSLTESKASCCRHYIQATGEARYTQHGG